MMSLPKTNENNGKIRTWAEPNQIYIIRKVLMRTIQNCNFIELNTSFTKPFGTHTFYQGGDGGSARLPTISKSVAPINLKLCRALETSFKALEMLKLFT